MLISPSLQRSFAHRKDHLKAVICRYDTDLLIIFLVPVLLETIYFNLFHFKYRIDGSVL